MANKKPSAKPSELVPQSGSVRPSLELRRRMLGALDDRLHVATDIIDRGKDSDKLAALNFLARYSGLDEIGVVVDTELLNALFTVIEFYVKDDDALADIRENGWMFSRTASECDACTLSAMYDAVA